MREFLAKSRTTAVSNQSKKAATTSEKTILAQPQPVLAAKESILSLIYNTTSHSIFLVGVEEEDGPIYRCLLVNKAYLETTGLLAQQILGKRIEEFLPQPALFSFRKSQLRPLIVMTRQDRFKALQMK